MPPAIVTRVTRKSNRRAVVQRYQDNIKGALQDFKGIAVKEMNNVVGNWKNKPSFVGGIYVLPDRIELYVEPTGPNAKYWEWTSRGTKPHKIYARNKPMLIFRRNYAPKTTVGPPPTYGGPGISSGPWVAKREVDHPGTRARHFEEYVAQQLGSDFRRVIENAIRRGLRRG